MGKGLADFMDEVVVGCTLKKEDLVGPMEMGRRDMHEL